MTQLTAFTWGVFPYICLVTMIVGTIYRYQSDQLRWGSKSSELLEKKLLTRGSILFHIGIFLVLGGHVAGLLVPMQLYDALGISPELYHTVAEVAGGAAGLMAFAGISILLYRRIANARVRHNSDLSDYVSDGLLWIVILLGLAVTLGYSTLYGPYEYRATVGPWIRGVLTLHPDVALMAGVPLILQVHIALAFLLFGISPFTRLIHIYSFPLGYLTRAPIQYRARYGYGYGYETVPARRRASWHGLPELPLGPQPDEEQPLPEPVGAGAGTRDKYAPFEPAQRPANGRPHG
ncbi:MAG TPA: respiratory nitrate reductase subunit gamma [Ktedonobacterales bacterium]